MGNCRINVGDDIMLSFLRQIPTTECGPVLVLGETSTGAPQGIDVFIVIHMAMTKTFRCKQTFSCTP